MAYQNKLNDISGRILRLEKKEALEILEASDVEYEILEPGYCPGVPVGEIYMVCDSFEKGIRAYVNREVEGLPDIGADEMSDLEYENAGLKVLYFSTPGSFTTSLDIEDSVRIISEDYIKTPEQISEELLGKNDAEAEKIIGEAGFRYKRIAGERSGYDTGLIYASEYKDGMICYYVSKGNINDPQAGF